MQTGFCVEGQVSYADSLNNLLLTKTGNEKIDLIEHSAPLP